jgi:hypothetical protein
MTATTSTPAQSSDPDSRVNASQSTAERNREDDAGSSDAFQAALEAEVARRIDAVERRWQSRKDRELNRARRRWESEAAQPIDPELLSWIAEADPRDIGQWLKSGLTEQETAASEAPADHEPPRAEASEAGEKTVPPTPEPPAQPDRPDANPPSDTEPVAERSADRSDALDAEDAAGPDLEREAEARDQLAERRSQDPSPDLFPSRGAPADAFHQIEAGFARGEVDLDTYETARRRHGLT